jgi:sporulation protein YpjB
MYYKLVRLGRISMLICSLMIVLLGCTSSMTSQGVDSLENTVQTNPERQHKLQTLNTASDLLYKKALTDDIQGVKQELDRITILISEIEFSGLSSIEGLHALTGSILEAGRLTNAVKIDMDAIKLNAAKIRFATDALTHKHDPLWHQYYELLTTDLQSVGQSVRDVRRTDAENAFAKFNLHLDTIKPAILISKQLVEVERIQSIVSYLKSQLRIQPHQVKEIQKGLLLLQGALDQLFEKNDQGAFLPIVPPENPVYWTIGIGTAIILALTYTAWKMYKGQEDIVPARKRVGE